MKAYRTVVYQTNASGRARLADVFVKHFDSYNEAELYGQQIIKGMLVRGSTLPWKFTVENTALD